MLRRLTIQNYVLIESLDIDFPNGLIIITGETGAGKSIMLGALSLLLGAKADASVLKDSGKNCVVEGEFCVDGEELILRRVISPSGRTRNFINDEPVTLAALTEISLEIVDIHAQHQHLLLTKAGYQMKVLDYFAGTGNLLQEYAECHEALLKARQLLEQLDEKLARNGKDMEYKQFQLGKLEEARLQEGELEELEAVQKQLANSGQIKESIQGALDMFRPMGNSVVQNLKDAMHLLQKSSNFVPGLEQLCSRIESCRIECKDIEGELELMADKIEVSPQKLQEVEERLSDLYSLLRKHQAATVEELIAIRNGLQEDLQGSTRDSAERDELASSIEVLEQQRNGLAEKLSGERRKHVKELGDILQRQIRDLQMPHAVFEVSLTDSGKYTALGKDTVEFLFAANGGSKLNGLDKVASGGELSRIMLCLKWLMAQYTGMPTMIFDEIDTGVSGSIADKMGELIGKMGEKMQIFAITHLPQIASKKGTHLLVYKEFDNENNATANIRELQGEDRVKEVARMLSGATLTPAALENARDLLKENDIKNK